MCSSSPSETAFGRTHYEPFIEDNLAVEPEAYLRRGARAESAALRRVRALLLATVWPTLRGGDHAGRDTAAAIESAGFAIEEIEHFRFPDVWVALPASPHILGIARLP